MKGRRLWSSLCPRSRVESGNGVEKWFKPGLEILFLRYYSKFDKGFDQTGSSHNGSYISASYNRNGHATPGEKADGKNKFLVGLENWRGSNRERSPGELNFYVYHPEQRGWYGDHFYPTGMVSPTGSDGGGGQNVYVLNLIRFLVYLDNEHLRTMMRFSEELNFYHYHPEQRPDHGERFFPSAERRRGKTGSARISSSGRSLFPSLTAGTVMNSWSR